MSKGQSPAPEPAPGAPILTDPSIEADGKPSAVAGMAGIAWLVCAASLAYAAFSQASITPEPRWSVAAWTWLAFAIAFCLGFRLLATPRGRYLRASVLGAITLVAVAAYQVAHASDTAVLPAIWASAGGVVSLLRLRSRPTCVAFGTQSHAPPSISTMFDRTERAPPALASLDPDGPASLASAAASPDACPFLGLSNDRATHFMFAVPGHRCHAGPKPEKIVLAHQGSYCLSDRFRECARFPAPDRRGAPPIGTRRVAAQAPATNEAVFALPIERLRAEMPGAYVPVPPTRTNALSPWRDGRAGFRRLITTLLLGSVLVIVVWAIVTHDPGRPDQVSGGALPSFPASPFHATPLPTAPSSPGRESRPTETQTIHLGLRDISSGAPEHR